MPEELSHPPATVTREPCPFDTLARACNLPRMLRVTEAGLYCAAGDFHIDPWRPVPRALITHAHSDHARSGSAAYLCAEPGVEVLRARLGRTAAISGVPYGERLTFNDVSVSFHPAGHVLGSAQIRVEHRGEIWVVSGDYKTQPDPTCAAFAPVRCHTFVTESTFGLPVYRWREPAAVFAEIHDWWRRNREAGRVSVLFAYSLGKAQRLLAGLDGGIGPVFLHPAPRAFLPAYRAAGISLPDAPAATRDLVRAAGSGALVIAPPATDGSTWLASLGDTATAFVSGWMQLRGPRRRRGADAGFVLSDHADWPGLLDAIASTGAERVLVTHGTAGPLVRWLNENGRQAAALATPFGDAEEGE